MNDTTRRTSIDIRRIRTDVDTQSREGINYETVYEYAEEMREGREFPPLEVVEDPVTHDIVLVDGRHRLAAKTLLEHTHAECNVRQGSMDDAKIAAAGSNLQHGLRRTEADKRKAVHLLLSTAEGQSWTPARIAQHCQVPLSLVEAIVVSTPWEPPQGLYGVDDLAKPPRPDYAREDAAKTKERAWRSARKFLRFVDKLEMDAVEFLREVMEELAKAKKKPRSESGVEG